MKQTIMRREALETPELIEKQLKRNKQTCRKLGEKIRKFNPSFVVTVGRGSSDHAGVFAKYLIEIELGIQVSSSAPSVLSIYKKNVNLENALVIFLSQSGRSPDILKQVKMAKSSGAYCIAIVNDETSPLAELVDAVLPVSAGQEKAVAATKSYLLTLSALLQLTAYWAKNTDLQNALETLPDFMKLTIKSSNQLEVCDFVSTRHCIVLGRGFGYALAQEIALKLKEVCIIHAEAFSSAEFLHGPVALANEELDIISINIEDEAHSSHKSLISEIDKKSINVHNLHQISSDMHPRIAALTLMQRFYIDVEKIALARGINPDAPPGLKKVTKTT